VDTIGGDRPTSLSALVRDNAVSHLDAELPLSEHGHGDSPNRRSRVDAAGTTARSAAWRSDHDRSAHEHVAQGAESPLL
jgi:hypothetical protein